MKNPQRIHRSPCILYLFQPGMNHVIHPTVFAGIVEEVVTTWKIISGAVGMAIAVHLFTVGAVFVAYPENP